ncbi:MAG: 16S rRNA (guanine(966)-N(2))-methyltransferase RsmD [Gammaproteobacteria bacterium]|nr:MAG: 16S rRNA (guanine(966)-N(2))-methyltransferase RsmD [Gammaproteobacteria bacterium]
MPTRHNPSRRAAHKVRIIGGRWKRWQVPVADRPGLRPTPDRVRETLFNWLADTLVGARCLDVFAGTGALGLEALSRGASAACFLERDPDTARELQIVLGKLGCDDALVIAGDALSWLQHNNGQRFDVVFLDPPYHSQCLGKTSELLCQQGWLASGAWIYLEFAADETAPVLPQGWRLHRETRAGQVRGWLCQHSE